MDVRDGCTTELVEDKMDVSENGISEEIETVVTVFATDMDGEVRTTDSD